MSSARIMVTPKGPEQVDGDILVYCLKQADKGSPACDPVVLDLVEKACELGDFVGKTSEQLMVYRGAVDGGCKAQRILILGLGENRSEK